MKKITLIILLRTELTVFVLDINKSWYNLFNVRHFTNTSPD